MMFLDSRTGYNLLRNVGAAYIFVDRKTSLSGLTFLKNDYIYSFLRKEGQICYLSEIQFSRNLFFVFARKIPRFF